MVILYQGTELIWALAWEGQELVKGLVWFRRGWDEGTKVHRDLWSTNFRGKMSDGRSNVPEGTLYKRFDSPQHIYPGLSCIKAQIFKAPFPSPHKASALFHIPSTSGYSTWLWVILPNLVISFSGVSSAILAHFCCHQGISNPPSNVRLKGFFCQTQTYYLLLAWCFSFLLPGHLHATLTLLRVTKKGLCWLIV